VETCTCIGIKRKEKKEGRGRGQENNPSPPRSCPPPHRRCPATPQRITAACSSTHGGPTRASAGAQSPDPHGVHDRWCWCRGRSSHRQNIQTNRRDRDETRKTQRRERGWKTRGGTSKIKEQSSGDGGARSVVDPEAGSSAPAGIPV